MRLWLCVGWPRQISGQLPLIGVESGLDPVHANIGEVKKNLWARRSEVPDRENWRMGYLATLLKERGEAFYGADEGEVTRLTSLIDSLCVN